MNRCAFPDCTTPILDRDSGKIMGAVCHIRAQNPGGKRYDAAQTPEERHGFDNLVLMCQNHHQVIDADERTYTVARLTEIKQAHEANADASAEDDVSPLLIEALQLSSYAAGAVHNDMRNATIKVGGEGGFFGGGGGQGGVLTIVGVTRLPDDVTVDLRGGDGQAPGAGGGGGGSLVFEGQDVLPIDIRDGLRVSNFMTVNSAVESSGLLYVLGGGWSYLPVSRLPSNAQFAVALVVECGVLAPDTLLRFEVVAEHPDGSSESVAALDVPVPDTDDMVPRAKHVQYVSMQARQFGIHVLRVRSAGEEFAYFPIEIRQAP